MADNNSRAAQKKAKAIADGTAPKEKVKSILGKEDLQDAMAARQAAKAEKAERDAAKKASKAKDEKPKMSKKEAKAKAEADMLAMLAGGTAGGKKKKKKKKPVVKKDGALKTAQTASKAKVDA
jgi:hypothetical protein